MKLNRPSAATLVLSLVAGVLVVLSSTALGFSGPVKEGTFLTLVFLSAEGISPLTGASFRSALHLPPRVSVTIGALLAVAAVGSTQIPGLSVGAHAVIEAALVIAAGLGFAPTAFDVPAGSGAARASNLATLALLVAAPLLLLTMVA